jgi:AAA+ ATPase superfamily predicted ATPase
MFVGRSYELQLLKKVQTSKRAELVIVYGRRRVGKSALLEKLINPAQSFTFEAIKGLSKKRQIAHFLKQLGVQLNKDLPRCESWEAAFDIFTTYIQQGKHTIIFDEFPWMASEKTELISILKYYWDRKWQKNAGIKLILCGSIANFMLKHLVHSQALHNRKTLELKIDPLPACEAKQFFGNKRSDFEICKFLMIFGGIPKYLEQIDVNQTLEQNLDRLCFTKSGFFLSEFESVFKEQFKVIKRYEEIVQRLSDGKKTKEQLQKSLKMSRGGGFGSFLEQLEVAGFISREVSLSFEEKTRKSKTQRYSLWDEWLKFYLVYVKRNAGLIQSQTKLGLSGRILDRSIQSYFGTMFEVFCRKNMSSILQSMEIDPSTVVDIGPYFRQASRTTANRGVQVDLCILRKGRVLTLIECKFRENPVGIEVMRDMENKLSALRVPRTFTVEKVLISASGVTEELDRKNYFHRILGLESIM